MGNREAEKQSADAGAPLLTGIDGASGVSAATPESAAIEQAPMTERERELGNVPSTCIEHYPGYALPYRLSFQIKVF